MNVFRRADGNGWVLHPLTCSASRAARLWPPWPPHQTSPPYRWPPPPWPPCRPQSERWMTLAPEVCLRKRLLILSGSLSRWPIPVTGWATAELLIERLKLTGTRRYITVDLDKLQDTLSSSSSLFVSIALQSPLSQECETTSHTLKHPQ